MNYRTSVLSQAKKTTKKAVLLHFRGVLPPCCEILGCQSGRVVVVLVSLQNWKRARSCGCWEGSLQLKAEMLSCSLTHSAWWATLWEGDEDMETAIVQAKMSHRKAAFYITFQKCPQPLRINLYPPFCSGLLCGDDVAISSNSVFNLGHSQGLFALGLSEHKPVPFCSVKPGIISFMQMLL